jgi:hypothetical protein
MECHRRPYQFYLLPVKVENAGSVTYKQAMEMIEKKLFELYEHKKIGELYVCAATDQGKLEDAFLIDRPNTGNPEVRGMYIMTIETARANGIR